MPRYHNIDGVNVQFTPEEEAARDAEEAAFEVAKSARVKLEKRQQALAEKWPDAFALLDDILERGIDSVRTERSQIKAANPKGD